MGHPNVITAAGTLPATLDTPSDPGSAIARTADDARQLASDVRHGHVSPHDAEPRLAALEQNAAWLSGPEAATAREAITDARAAVAAVPRDYVAPSLSPRAEPRRAEVPPNALAPRPQGPTPARALPQPDPRGLGIEPRERTSNTEAVLGLLGGAPEVVESATAYGETVFGGILASGPATETALETFEIAGGIAETASFLMAPLTIAHSMFEMAEAVCHARGQGVSEGLLSGLESEQPGWRAGTYAVLMGMNEASLGAARAALPPSEREHFDQAVASAETARRHDASGFEQASHAARHAAHAFQDGVVSALSPQFQRGAGELFDAGRAAGAQWARENPGALAETRTALAEARRAGVDDATEGRVDPARYSNDAAYRLGAQLTVESGIHGRFTAVRI